MLFLVDGHVLVGSLGLSASRRFTARPESSGGRRRGLLDPLAYTIERLVELELKIGRREYVEEKVNSVTCVE